MLSPVPDPAGRSSVVPRLAHAMMLAGGTALLGIAILTTASVLSRWLLGRPIPGDFELVQAGSGLAIFGFLAHGTLMRSNIMVDSFTSWLPHRLAGRMDALWSLAWAACAAALAWGMGEGALDAWSSGTRSMVLGLSLWWAVALGALGLVTVALAALRDTRRQWRNEAP